MKAMHVLSAAIALALPLGLGLRANADQNAMVVSQAANGGTLYSPLPPKVQEDLGDMRPAAVGGILSYFHGQASVNTQYISNAPLYHSRDDADFLIMPRLEEDFSAPLGKHLKVDVTVRAEDYTYASHQSLGFWGFSGNADLEYRYKPSWPRIYAGVEPYFYYSYQTGTQLRQTAAYGPAAGVDQTWTLDRGKTLLLAGYHFGQYYPFGGVARGSTYDLDERQSHTTTLSLTQQIKPNLYAQICWEGQYSIYSEAHRDEMLDVVGVSLIHQFTPETFVSLFVDYVNNASNNSLAKYETVNTGVVLEWQY
jgi:hypothetical protein